MRWEGNQIFIQTSKKIGDSKELKSNQINSITKYLNEKRN